MATIVRDVRDLSVAERSAIERLLGHALQENQKLVIQVTNGAPTRGAASAAGPVPDWCRVYEGLSDDQVDEVEKIVFKRANLTRSR